MNHIEIRSEVDDEVIALYRDGDGWTVTPRNPDDIDQLWHEIGMELALGEKPPTMAGDKALGDMFLSRVTRERGMEVQTEFENPRLGILAFLAWMRNLLFGHDEEAADTDQLPDPGLEERRQLAREGRLACGYNVFRQCSFPTCGAHEGGSIRTWTLRDRTIIGAPQTP